MAEPFEHIQRLAELFLSRTPKKAATESAPELEQTEDVHERPDEPPESTFEIILVGHLPVRAGLWLTQYADELAREHGPTALIRMEQDQQILEILRGRDTATRASAAADIAEAIRLTRNDIARWVIRTSGESLDDVLRAQPDTITILTGADEAATVAAYTIVKEVHTVADLVGTATPPLEIAVLGADVQDAEQAFERLRQTAMDHLDLTVTMGRCVRSMGALGSTLHFRFSADEEIGLTSLAAAIHGESPVDVDTERKETVVSEFEHEFEHEREHEPVAPAAEAADDSFSVTIRDDPLRTLATPVPSGGFEVQPTRRHTTEETVTTAEPPTTARVRPKPSVQIEAKAVPAGPPARPAKPARPLATWLEGLALLPVRCPLAEDVELAVDTAGNLHVIAWHDRLRAVHAAGAWVSKNRSLLAAACSDHTIAPRGGVMTHLVTPEPAQVADLFDTDLHLHVLAAVDVEGKTGWYAAALNAR